MRDGKHGNTCDVENCFEQVIDDFSSNISELRRPDKEDLDLHSFKAELIYIALWANGLAHGIVFPFPVRMCN